MSAIKNLLQIKRVNRIDIRNRGLSEGAIKSKYTFFKEQFDKNTSSKFDKMFLKIKKIRLHVLLIVLKNLKSLLRSIGKNTS